MITTEMFCRVWNASSSCREAAEALGMTQKAASVRASEARKSGVALKKFSRRKTTVNKINALLKADAMAGKTVEELVKE